MTSIVHPNAESAFGIRRFTSGMPCIIGAQELP